MRNRDLEFARLVYQEHQTIRSVAKDAGISISGVKAALRRLKLRGESAEDYCGDEITETTRSARDIQREIDDITAEVKASWAKPVEARSSMIPTLEARLEELHAEKRAALALGLK